MFVPPFFFCLFVGFGVSHENFCVFSLFLKKKV